VIYVANTTVFSSSNGTVPVIDGKTNTLVADVKVGGNPTNISVNPSTNMIYITASNGLPVIDGKPNTVTANIK